MLVGRLNAAGWSGLMNAWSPVLLRAKFWILRASGLSPFLSKLISLTSCPISGAGGVAFGGENPKSPSREYSAAPSSTGSRTNDLGAKSIPVNDESAPSIAKGDVICCGGNLSTSAIGTFSFRTVGTHAGNGMFGGLWQRSSLGPPIGLNTAWLDGRKPNRSGQP